MTIKGKRKCPICGRFIENMEDAVPMKSRYAHKTCLNNAVIHASDTEKKKATKKCVPPKDCKQIAVSIPVSEAEYKEKRAVLDYIEKLTNNKPNAKVYKLLEDYSKKYRFSFTGMLNGLQYYFEVLDNPVEGDCIGIIPYVYDEAQEYMERIKESADANDKFTSKEIEAMYPAVKVRVVRKKEELELIDIASLQQE